MSNAITVQRSTLIGVPPEDAFARTLPMPLPTLFHRWYGPIPPIIEVRDQTGQWGAVGQTRTIALAGGGTMRETLTALDPPRSFSYSITDLTGPMAPLVGHIEGEWIFAPHRASTEVTWRWTLHRRSALTAPGLRVFAWVWRGYAGRALESLTHYLAR